MNTSTSTGSTDQLQVEASHYIQKDPRKLTNSNEILSCLSWYQSEEATLSNSLAGLLSDRDSIADSLRRLETLVPYLNDLCLESRQLKEKVSSTAKTADRVGGRVRTLDQEMSRVSQAAERVGQVMELKVTQCMLCSTCLPGLHSPSHLSLDCSLASNTRTGSRQLDIALVLCRFPLKSSLDPLPKPPWYIRSRNFTYTKADISQPTAENHLPPAQALQAMREQLLSIFLKQFAQASRSRDAAATSRYFKLFPAIGWEAEGLEAYAAFVVDLVRVRAPISAKSRVISRSFAKR